MKDKKEFAKMITKNISTCAVLLAICIVSQFFKNLSVFITGPIINACLIIAVLSVGYEWGMILSVITPITAFIITGSPLIAAVPLVMPCIMAGNIILISVLYGFTKYKKSNKFIIWGLGLGSVLKSLFMGIVISLIIIPMFIPETSPLYKNMSVFQFTMGTAQFITAVIGSILAFFIWIPLKKSFNNKNYN